MDVAMFGNGSTGLLVPIEGHDPRRGPWRHHAFVPEPLSTSMPALAPQTYLGVANARAALAALDSTARQLPNPTLLRRPTLRREAQSTSALEGTYAPLSAVLTADEDAPPSTDLREILNYVAVATQAFAATAEGRPLNLSGLCNLQATLVAGTPGESTSSGDVRDIPVVIGRRADATPDQLPVQAARFVPSPPGEQLRSDVQALVDWMQVDHRATIDPVVAAAMAHYQFETLHPFHDGNGRLGRLLIVVQLHAAGVLSEPTLTVSPWFESRRTEYYDHLLAVSAHGAWDAFVRFFAAGIAESAALTHRQMLALVRAQDELKDVVRRSPLRADTAHLVIDHAVANPVFTVRSVERDLGLSYGRANAVVAQLVELGVLECLDPNAYNRRFFAPQVHEVLLTVA
ncbi:Fic/DOC family N-terminal domain-containing protein [Nocardioides perillae]|uniref:Fic family protein n=1 Tax=Nocardioides perillae TaxID=1119534 RepID=A0A7Y9RVJ7_9ACTN|nr:Fic family protein [Nocardioides perillae]